MRSVDVEVLHPGEFVAVVWQFLTADRDPKDVDRVRGALWRPPKGVVAKEGPWSAEAETSAFRALKAQTTGAIGSPKS